MGKEHVSMGVCVDIFLTLVCLQGANVLLNDQGEVKLGRWMGDCICCGEMSHFLQQSGFVCWLCFILLLLSENVFSCTRVALHLFYDEHEMAYMF